MPNRIIKDSICFSDDLEQLSWFEQCFYIRLIVSVDDFGRFDGRSAIIKGRLFPLSNVTTRQIDDALARLSSAGMVLLYTVSGRPYLQIIAFRKHQSPRAHESKYPAPEDAENICTQMQTDACKCEQTHADAPDIRYSNTNSINDIRYSNASRETRAKSFTPPTVDEVADYVKHQCYHVDPQRFIDYYQSNGWKVGRNSMKDWKAAVRTWEQKDKPVARRGRNDWIDEAVLK